MRRSRSRHRCQFSTDPTRLLSSRARWRTERRAKSRVCKSWNVRIIAKRLRLAERWAGGFRALGPRRATYQDMTTAGGDAERVAGVASGAPSRLVLFDGECNLCNAAVRWLIERDAEGKLVFAPLQSAAASAVLGRAVEGMDLDRDPDSIVFVDDEGVYLRSTAVLRAIRHLGFPHALLAIGLLVPRPLRDAVYRLIARNRYRWFGRRATCMVPAAGLARRFLDASSSTQRVETQRIPSSPGRDTSREERSVSEPEGREPPMPSR